MLSEVHFELSPVLALAWGIDDFVKACVTTDLQIPRESLIPLKLRFDKQRGTVQDFKTSTKPTHFPLALEQQKNHK